MSVIGLSFTLLAAVPPARYSYLKLGQHPHDTQAYTQGLFFHEDTLYESTGQKGSSWIRKVDISTGQVLQEVSLDEHYFGEGIACFGQQIYQLTWQQHQGFIYDRQSLQQIDSFSYETEGWGLTRYENHLVMSDGTEKLYFYHPEGFVKSHEVQVYDDKGKVEKLNELETVGKLIFANQYQTRFILAIDPLTGQVVGKLDLTRLMDDSRERIDMDVMNGIAYDESQDRFFVTGKWWPKLFEIKISP